MTHESRFHKPGDYRTFEVAGFSFLVMLGKDNMLRAFHNICRHRAYAVTKKECGSSTVLGCRYHGWSYDTKGKLIKAPEFDSVPDFDKDMNSLWELKLEILEGMVFVNFHAGEEVMKLEPEDIETKLKKWKVAQMKCTADWKVEGSFNWKMTGRSRSRDIQAQSLLPPGFLSGADKVNPPTFWVQLPEWIRICPESVSVSHTTIIRRLTSGKVLVMKSIPKSSRDTIQECTLLGFETRTPESALKEVQRQVRKDVKELSSKQAHLLRDPATPFTLETVGPLQDIKELLKTHMSEESKLGAEIRPAVHNISLTRAGIDDDNCKAPPPNFDH